MKAKLFQSARILGLAPTTRGFGWISFDGPFDVQNFGLVFVRSDRNIRCVRHFERLLDKLRPALVVMEEGTAKACRSARMTALYEALQASAARHGVEVVHYTRGDVEACFAKVGARTNQEIAEAVARQVQDLVHKLPRKRVQWVGEDRRIALFWAAALVITHHFIGRS